MTNPSKPGLKSVIAEVIRRALQEASDRVVRVELPFDWPVSEAAIEIRGDAPALRIGVLRPFTQALADGVSDPVSTGAAQITTWRNQSTKDEVGLLILGDASGPDESGLLDIRIIVTRERILNLWEERARTWLDAHVVSDAPGPLVEALFERAAQADIDAISLDQYLTGLPEKDEAIESLRDDLWKLSLIPDRRAMDTGLTKQRLSTNLEIRELLTSSADTQADARKIQRLKESSAKSAKAALEFRETLDRNALQDCDLEELENILATPKTKVRRDKRVDLFDFLDISGEKGLSPEEIKEHLEALGEGLDLDGQDDGTSSSKTVTFSDQERIEVSVTIEASGDDAYRWVHRDVHDELEEIHHRLILFSPISATRDWLIAPSGTDAVPGDRLEAAAEMQDERLDSSQIRTLVDDYLSRRLELSKYERWLNNDALELMVLKPEVREAARNFLDAWWELVFRILDSEKMDFVESFVPLVETMWGTDDQDSAPAWAVLGPFHPYTLEPLVRVADFVEANIGSEVLGSKAAWAIDRSVPAYRAIWARNGTLFLSRFSPTIMYEADPEPLRPRVTSGKGLVNVVKAYLGFHEYAKRSLVVTLVNPPKGRGLPRDLRSVERMVEHLKVLVVSTGGEFASLADFDGDVAFLGTFKSIGDWLEQSPARCHIVYNFTDYSGGRENLAAQKDKYTPGAHVAPQIDIRPSSSLADVGKYVPYVTFEPRESNRPVVAYQRLTNRGAGPPPTFEIAPMLSERAQEEIESLRSVSDWVVVGAPAPLGLVPPLKLGDLDLLGRETYGPYGLFVYASSLFAIRKVVVGHLAPSPVALPDPDELEERLIELAVGASRGVLKLASRGTALAEHIGLIVANEIAKAE